MLKRFAGFSLQKLIFWATGLLLVGLAGYQYFFVYPEEKKNLQHAKYMIRKQLAEIQNLHKYEEKLKQTEIRLEHLSQQLPGELGPEDFFKGLEKLGQELGLEVRLENLSVSSKDFYKRAQLTVRLSGNDKNFDSFLSEIKNGKRLVHISPLDHKGEEARIDFSIFSVPQFRDREFKVETGPCSTFKSRVWLWPLSRKIQKSERELSVWCEKQQAHIPDIRLVKKIKYHLADIHKLEEIAASLRGFDRTAQ